MYSHTFILCFLSLFVQSLKATLILIRPSFRLSVPPEFFITNPSEVIFVVYYSWGGLHENLLRNSKFLLKLDKNIKHFTRLPKYTSLLPPTHVYNKKLCCSKHDVFIPYTFTRSSTINTKN